MQRNTPASRIDQDDQQPALTAAVLILLPSRTDQLGRPETTYFVGVFIMLGEHRIQTVCERAFEHKALRISKRAITGYHQYILHPEKGWVTWHLAHFPAIDTIDKVDLPHIQAFADDMLRTYAIRTVHLAICGLRSVVFRFALIMKMIARDPSLGVDLPRIKKERGWMPSYDDFVRVMKAISADDWIGRRDLALLALYGFTGVRRGELLALRFTDYRPAEKILHLEHREKSGLTQDIPVCDELAAVLDHYLELRPAGLGDALILSAQYSGDGHNGLSSVRANKIVKARGIAAGVPKLCPHSLRRMLGTRIYAITGDVYAAKEILGHSDLQTTVAHYAAPSAERIREAVKRISA